MNREKTVKEFHTLFNVPTVNTINDDSVNLLRVNLIREELKELEQALQDRNAVEVLDALCDLQYVLSGTIEQLGFSKVFKQAFKEVHNSNMSKACDSFDEASATVDYYMKYRNTESTIHETKNNKYLVKRNLDGKVLKSINYKPAKLNRFIDELDLQ